MAGNLTLYTENSLLGHLTGVEWSAPTNTYLGLFTVAPTDTTAGTEVSTATGYARQQMSWGTPSGGAVATNANIRFPTSGPAANNYGTIVAIGIFDAVTAGNLLEYGSLAASVTINTGDSWTVSTAGITLTLD